MSKKSKILREVTLLQAIAECYNFNLRKKIGSEILFEVRFCDENDNSEDKDTRIVRFGKHWSKVEHEWKYLEWKPNCPCFGQNEKHWLSNLFCIKAMRENCIYGAQQGDFHVYEVEL